MLPLAATAQQIELAPVGEPGTSHFDRGGDPVIISHSVNMSVAHGGVACFVDGAGSPTQENNYWRVFDLEAFDVMGDLHINTIFHGIAPTTDAAHEQTITIYTVDGSLSWATVDEVTSVDFNVTTGDFGDVKTIEFEPAVVIPAGSVMAVRVHIPHSDGQYVALAGFNSDGQTGDTFIHSDDCNVADPTPLVDLNPDWEDIGWVLAVGGTDMGVSTEGVATARSIQIGSAYPNPASGVVTLPIELENGVHVLTTIHDVLGRQVDVVMDQSMDAGSHSVRLDTSGLASGTYYVRMMAGNEVVSSQLVVVR